ncbi:MAG: M1 family metallopeptidase [bacterium]|nr:M1 family metallopeptidase [bacterium]
MSITRWSLVLLIPLLMSACGANDLTPAADTVTIADDAVTSPKPFVRAEPLPVPLKHRLEVKLDPVTHSFVGRDTLMLLAPVTSVEFLLNAALTPKSACRLERMPDSDLPDQSLVGWRLEQDEPAAAWIVEYSGELFQDVSRAVFSRENVGAEIRATVSEQGIYLAGGGGWYPLTEDGFVSFRVTTVMPVGWKSVTQGKRVHESVEAGWTRWTWDAPLPSDGLNLVAARFRVDTRMHGDTSVETWFFPEDSTLASDYLDACERFLDLYESFLTPYPYPRFAVVENFFSTGYGMPGWTLLGQRVLRLPFIKHISLGHEIAHNWWGNSVFVGDGGNWCEGITVYTADYLYKEMQSAAAATQYRKDLLKDYTRYTRAGGDFPLVEFVSRHNAATRSVGYGKSMMVFHALEELVGRETFRNALRRVVAERQWADASWTDFFRAVETEAGMRSLALEGERKQWIERAGAAALELGVTAVRRDGAEWLVEIELKQVQPGEPLVLRVPVRLNTTGGVIEETVVMNAASHRLELRTPNRPGSVSVDPDYHVFRRLYEEEMESTLGLILADEAPVFVLEEGLAADMADACRDFAANWVEGDPVYSTADELVDFGGTVIWLGTRPPAFRPAPPELHMNKLFTSFQGERFDPGNYALVYTGKRGVDRGFMAVLADNAEQLAAIVSRTPHYGKYSYLGFASGRNSLKGNWPAAAGPLIRRLD